MTDSMSVSELNEYTRTLLENDVLLQMINVSGEISNFKRHSSGHIYFTLKDEKSKIDCSFFKNYNYNLKFEPENGMLVTVTATATVYERDGKYQLLVYKMAEQGTGRLYELFEKLKNQLDKEGLFSEEHKKRIPLYPKRIAVLTSPTGAAVRDIISVTGRRAKNTEIVIVPVPVQGEGTAGRIAKALSYADSKLEADIIIVARGGGSIEELWAFNEEVLARAIFNCKTPVISGVGHETDYTICDFVADIRAATPSAAAEIATQNIEDVGETISVTMDRIIKTVENRISLLKQRADSIFGSAVIRQPVHNIEMQRQYLDRMIENMQTETKNRIMLMKSRSENAMAGLQAVDPFKVLDRGYAIVSSGNKTVTGIDDVKTGDILSVRLSKGELICTVNEKHEEARS